MLGKRSTIVVVGYPNNVTDAAQSINNSISRKRERCRRFPMHGRRHGLQSDCATHVLNIPETCEAFVRCGCAEPNDPPQRCWIGGQVDRSILICCAWAERCCAAVAVPHFQAVGVSGDRTRCGRLTAVVQRTVDASDPKDRVVCRDAPASAPSRG
ncbi:hypothetical protein TcBrA4_0043190 [Trypanosoma cruzi]|nr:hypothetical protein TcBrA4_0043190 [Trypanosoma cruzi]